MAQVKKSIDISKNGKNIIQTPPLILQHLTLENIEAGGAIYASPILIEVFSY